ncbi:MAG: S-adenosylmethionine decarboxylase [Deltaproteobacteria bacterium]|nr:S-adenosylmethionine decarboxylase [Deltaproteobacteria bacterium]
MKVKKPKTAYTPSSTFGEHLCIDGYKGSFEKLNNKRLVVKCLNELPELLGMKKLCKPHVYYAPDNSIKDCGGWSGFVVIAESHISIHTFPCRGFLSADIYTCKDNMGIDFIISYFKKRFELKDVETNFIKRGTRYPTKNVC